LLFRFKQEIFGFCYIHLRTHNPDSPAFFIADCAAGGAVIHIFTVLLQHTVFYVIRRFTGHIKYVFRKGVKCSCFIVRMQPVAPTVQHVGEILLVLKSQQMPEVIRPYEFIVGVDRVARHDFHIPQSNFCRFNSRVQ
jgi:hypothetical protein